MGLRHAFNQSQPWIRIWFQNLKKEYPNQDGKGKLVNVRGSVSSAQYKGGFSYQFLLGIKMPVVAEFTCYEGDNKGALQIHLAGFFFQLFLTIENVFKPYKKVKDKRNGYEHYVNPMGTGIRIDDHGVRIEIWNDQFEWRSDGTNRILSWSKEWPWNYASCTLWEVQKEDGTFGPVDHSEYPDRLKEFTFPYKDGRKMYIDVYRYQLRRGEIQKRIATYHVSRMTWHKRYQKWPLMGWAKWPEKVVTSIDVRFNDEVGERSGSWKGGCTGCSYEMKPGETPLQTLRRMESERKFN